MPPGAIQRSLGADLKSPVRNFGAQRAGLSVSRIPGVDATITPSRYCVGWSWRRISVVIVAPGHGLPSPNWPASPHRVNQRRRPSQHRYAAQRIWTGAHRWNAKEPATVKTLPAPGCG